MSSKAKSISRDSPFKDLFLLFAVNKKFVKVTGDEKQT
jgi:hypothetical protein